MKIPQPTGAQGLRGIIVAESEVPDPPNGMVVGQGPPDQGQFAMLLAMIQRNVAALTGLVNQLRSDYRALGNQSATQTLIGAGVNLPGPELPPVGYTTAFVDSQADRDNAILLATIQSMQQGTYHWESKQP